MMVTRNPVTQTVVLLYAQLITLAVDHHLVPAHLTYRTVLAGNHQVPDLLLIRRRLQQASRTSEGWREEALVPRVRWRDATRPRSRFSCRVWDGISSSEWWYFWIIIVAVIKINHLFKDTCSTSIVLTCPTPCEITSILSSPLAIALTPRALPDLATEVPSRQPVLV